MAMTDAMGRGKRLGPFMAKPFPNAYALERRFSGDEAPIEGVRGFC
jgi:hypothetical protein